MGFPGGSAGKESTCIVGDLTSIAGLGRSHGKEKGYLLQYSGLENSMDCIVHGIELNMSEQLSLFSLFCIGLEEKHWLFTLKPVGFWNGTYTISSLGSQSFGLG